MIPFASRPLMTRIRFAAVAEGSPGYVFPFAGGSAAVGGGGASSGFW